MRKKKNGKLRKIIAGVLCCVLLIAVGLGVMVKRFVSEAYLVEQIEGAINSKVEIGEIKLSLLRSPACLTLKDVRLSAKQGDWQAGDTEVSVKQVDLSVSLWSLLNKRIEVNDMTIRGAHVKGTVYEKGGSSLEALFESPEKARKRLSRKSTQVKEGRPKHRSPKKRKKKLARGEPEKKEGGFNVFDQEDFVAALGGFHLEDSSVDLIVEKSGLHIQCSGVNLSLGSLEIDPRRLEDTDSARLDLTVNIRLDSTEGWSYARLDIQGQAVARLFNPETGDMEPDVEGAFDLGDDSWINTRIPVITEAWKELHRLEKIGIKIAPLPEKATFGRSESLAAHYHRGMVTVRQPLSLWLGDWEFAVMSGSWLQTETNQHTIKAEVSASRGASSQLEHLLVKGLDYLPNEVREPLVCDMQEKLFRDGRFVVKIKSQKDLSHPKIRLVDGVPDFGKEAEKAGKKLLLEKAGGFLDGLLGN
jgi:hypothetical protein